MFNTNTAYFAASSSNGVSDQDEPIGDVCIANISPRERKLRLNFAIQQFVIALVVLGVMIFLHINPLWRLLLFFLISAATVSYFQARDKT